MLRVLTTIRNVHLGGSGFIESISWRKLRLGLACKYANEVLDASLQIHLRHILDSSYHLHLRLSLFLEFLVQ